MPRPKGSKNKKKVVDTESLESRLATAIEEQKQNEQESAELTAQIEEAKKRLVDLKRAGRKLSATIESLTAEKEAIDNAQAMEQKRKDVAVVVDELIGEGKSSEEIIALLRGGNN